MALIKVCSNGDRSRYAHPAVPIAPGELAADAVACVRAGAGAFHIHPRDPEGADTLDAEPAAVALQAVRAAVPGVPVGGTTMIGIAGGDPERRLALVRAWTVTPDFVSLNIEEPGADELARVLVELDDPDPQRAVRQAWEIEAALDAAGIGAPRLHHAEDVATWAVIDAALARGRDVRIGLEDTLVMADGSPACDNASLVAAVAGRAESR